MSKHVFCRDLCIAREEPLAGMGTVPQRYLMLRWPRGKWRSPRFESVDVSPGLTAAMRGLVQNGCNIVLYDRVGETETLPMLVDPIGGVATDYCDEAELIALIEAFGRGVPLIGRAETRKTILVCTDSRTDACCARYGFAAYKAIDAAADPERFNVVQTTHLGGCRFAATIIALPMRQRYGRFAPEEAGAFLASIEQGGPYLPAYRGRTGLPEPLQIAEVALQQWAEAHHHAPEAAAIEETGVPETPVAGDEVLVGGHVAGQRLAVRVRAQIFPMHSGCEAVNAPEPPKDYLRWRLVGVESHP